MKIIIVEVENFSKVVDSLIRKRLLSPIDYECFKSFLGDNPEAGDMISGTGGVRKIRLKAPSKGKRGGFRVCYYYVVGQQIYLLWIYAKNEQEDLSMKEKKQLKALVKSYERA